jgi:hypothetical protein
MIIKLAGFMGANLALHPKLLAEQIGVASINQKPGRGDLRPWKSAANVATVAPGRLSIYRMGRDTPSDTNYWLSWTTSVCVVRGYDTTASGERTYYTGSGTPKWTDVYKALGANAPVASRELGVPAPTTAPTLSASGGASATMETRYYLYTFVTDAGEESAPGPVSAAIVCKQDDTVAITAAAAAPSGNYGITLKRIYRTQGTSAGADFFFLRDIASSGSATTDDNRALGEVLPTTTWLPAPGVPQGGALNITEPTLQRLTPMWNGMVAGISGRGVRFCVPYTLYAWPIGYEVVPVDVTPVALATFGQTLVVLTTGKPAVIQGGTPEALDEQPVEYLQACVSADSAVGMGHGVAWASPDGLAYLGGGGPRLLTEGLMLREDWQALKPETIVGCMYERRYLGFYQPSPGVYKGFMIDPTNPAGIYFIDFGAAAVYVDDLQDALYVLNGTNIQKWDAGTALMTTFKSKLFQLPKPTRAFAVAEIVADAYPVTFKLYADGALVHTRTVTTPEPFRLPSGYYSWNVQVEVSANVAVQGISLAHSMEELAAK